MSDEPDELNETTSAYSLDLPVAPNWFSNAPMGTVDDGILLSMAALEQALGRPEIFVARQSQMCDAEFVL